MQIARQLGRARSTVYAYLRDFRLHRDHILRTVAADRLAEQLYLLTHPDTEPEQCQRHIAAARELRLLLLNLPAIQLPEPLESPGISRTEPEQSSNDPEPSGQIWTDLDKSGLDFEESPVPSSKSPKITPNSRPPNHSQPTLPVHLNNIPADLIPGRLVVSVTPVNLGNRRSVRPP